MGIGILALEPIVSVLLGLLGSVGDVLNQLLISPNANAILSLNGFGEVRPAPDALNPWQAAGVLLAYIVVLIGSSIIVFRRRDVPSGS